MRRSIGTRRGLSLIEVMMALVILGVVTMIFFQTTKFSGSNQGKTRDWTAQAAAIEKVMESLRSDYSMTTLQSISFSRVDSSQGGAKINLKVQGNPAPAAVATASIAAMLAQVTVSAWKTGTKDTLTITSILWVN